MRERAPVTVVAEYGDRFSADVAAACLTDHGIDCSVQADPAHHIAPHLVTLVGFRVEVRVEDAEDARSALGLDHPDPEADELDRVYHHTPLRFRPRWIRWLAFGAAAGVIIPVVVTVVMLVITLLNRLAPG